MVCCGRRIDSRHVSKFMLLQTIRAVTPVRLWDAATLMLRCYFSVSAPPSLKIAGRPDATGRPREGSGSVTTIEITPRLPYSRDGRAARDRAPRLRRASWPNTRGVAFG